MIKGKIYIETDPSGRSICCECNQPIAKGTQRVVEQIGSGKWQKVSKFCTRCGHNFLSDIITLLNIMQGRLICPNR